MDGVGDRRVMEKSERKKTLISWYLDKTGEKGSKTFAYPDRCHCVLACLSRLPFSRLFCISLGDPSILDTGIGCCAVFSAVL